MGCAFVTHDPKLITQNRDTMTSVFLRIFIGLAAMGLGIGMSSFWKQLRPHDPFWPILAGVSIATALASFVAGIALIPSDPPKHPQFQNRQ